MCQTYFNQSAKVFFQVINNKFNDTENDNLWQSCIFQY